MTKTTKDIIVDSVKLVLSIAAGIGAEIVCATAAGKIAHSEDLNPVGMACVGLTGIVVGGIISDAADTYIDKTVDGIIETAGKAKEIAVAIRESGKESDI